MLGRLVIICVILVLLSGCGPVYKTTYYYSEPENVRGRECVITCQKNRQKCENWAEQAYQQCLNRKSIERIATTVLTRPERRSPFYTDYSDGNCRFEKSRKLEICLVDFNACFQLCGGVVDSIEECVANCG